MCVIVYVEQVVVGYIDSLVYIKTRCASFTTGSCLFLFFLVIWPGEIGGSAPLCRSYTPAATVVSDNNSRPPWLHPIACWMLPIS